MTTDNPPFSKAFVLKTTTRHMRRACDISIGKTFDRLKDFDKNSEAGQEILETLDVLHRLRQMVDDFQKNNKTLFTDKK
jgi:hypothetical protein